MSEIQENNLIDGIVDEYLRNVSDYKKIFTNENLLNEIIELLKSKHVSLEKNNISMSGYVSYATLLEIEIKIKALELIEE